MLDEELTECPRCGRHMDDDSPWAHESDCPYEPCDDPSCRALKEPGDSSYELHIALDHWRSHGYLHGCSHGS